MNPGPLACNLVAKTPGHNDPHRQTDKQTDNTAKMEAIAKWGEPDKLHQDCSTRPALTGIRGIFLRLHDPPNWRFANLQEFGKMTNPPKIIAANISINIRYILPCTLMKKSKIQVVREDVPKKVTGIIQCKVQAHDDCGKQLK